MPVFDQLGDPVCPDCLCEHHEAAYAERTPTGSNVQQYTQLDLIPTNTTIVQVPITITETCCVVVNAAMMTPVGYLTTQFEIERPLGTIRTQQEDSIDSLEFKLMHHAAWEVLDAGSYTYYLVNRHTSGRTIYASWIKAIASDCEG